MAWRLIAIGLTSKERRTTMNKRLLAVFVLSLWFFNLSAQTKEFYPSLALTEAKISDGILFGLKGGINFPRLYYTNAHLSNLPHDLMITPSAGAFIEFPLFKSFAVAPELNYQQRGGATSYVYEGKYDVSYKFEAEYVSMRIPFICYFPVSNMFRPYVFAAPDAGYVVGGKISLMQPGLNIEGSEIGLNNSNINRYYFGLLGGAGIRMNLLLQEFTLVIKADAAVNFGLLDTFSESEHNETASPTNVYAYNHQGMRNSRGLEVSISIGFIRIKGDDVCDHFNSYKTKRIKHH